jgi:hypothetical protein
MAASLVRANEIGRLRVQGDHNEAVALRLRLSQLLGSANLSPPGIAPAAVLIVRQLSDPLPGKLAVRQATTGNRAWEEAARDRLAALYRQAVRPVQGVVPGRGAAVYFSDEAELLACLVLGLSRGQLGDDWWWQLILRRLPGRQAASLSHLLASQPRLLPAVFYHLASWGQSTAVIQKITPEQARTLLTNLAQAHALPAPRFWQQATAVSEHKPNRDDLIDAHQLLPRPGLALPPATTTPPWNDWLPAAQLPSHLGPERRCLLAIALSLHRRPTAVYSQTFWQEMGHWWRAEKLATNGQRAVPKQFTAEPNVLAPEPVVTSAKQVESTAVSAPQTTTLPQAQPTPPPETNKRRLATASSASPNIGPPTRSQESVAESLSPRQPAADQAPTEWPATGILTRIGGLFYLINIMQRLDIPGCYEADWGLAAQVGGWGALELLARGLLGPDQAHLAADPVWAALAAIDSRAEGELPGERYSVSGEQHPVSGEQLVASPLLAGLNPALGGWLTVALPPVRAYLQQVLQLSNPAEIGPRLLLVNGRLYVSATHIDLVMGLEAIALPVRLAGLDINPGWVPTLGRVIQFHFQEAI